MKRPFSPLPAAVMVAVLALVGLLAYGVASKEPDDRLDEAAARGERVEAPDFELPLLEGGGSASLSDWRGKVVVLNYWASWCKPCRDESPLLERWHRRIEPRGGTVVGVDVLDVTADAKDFIREFGLTYPMLRDSDGSTHKELGVVAYPETFVIDRSGRITATRRGPVDEEFLEAEVTPLLDEEEAS